MDNNNPSTDEVKREKVRVVLRPVKTKLNAVSVEKNMAVLPIMLPSQMTEIAQRRSLVQFAGK